MSEHLYLQRIRAVWDELEALLKQARRRGVRGLEAKDLARLDCLYRLCTIHLAQVRSRLRNDALAERLNPLVARAHSLLYVSHRANPLTGILAFYLNGFARVVARTARFHAIALILFVLGAVGAYYASFRYPEAAYAFLPAGERRLPGSSSEQLEIVLRSGRDQGSGDKLAFASILLSHNTKMGFLAFASGVLCGIPTVFLIVTIGAGLGVFAAVHHRHGVVSELWAWILPHGITEISAFILCGGAGIMLGAAIVCPGCRTRRKSLQDAGKEALRLVLGVIPMFILAGCIESFVRQSRLATEERLTLALATAVIWTIYFLFGFVAENKVRRAAAAEALSGENNGHAGP